MTVKNYIDEFLQYHRKHGNKVSTITDYIYHLKPFIRFVGEETEIENITNELIYEFADDLLSQKYSKATVSSYMRASKIFCRWLCDRNIIELIIKDIPSYTMPARDCPIYTNEEIKQILASCKTSKKWMTTRNQLFISFMIDSGMRQIEVVRLKKQDVDRGQKRIKVFGKGDKYRYVPLGTVTKILLDKYLEECPYKETDYIFLSDDGTQLTGNAIRIVTNRMKKALGFKFSSHILRHNFATNYLLLKYEQTGRIDMYGLKVIMGHVSTSTTQLYVHLVQSLIACRDAPSKLDTILGISEKSISEMTNF